MVKLISSILLTFSFSLTLAANDKDRMNKARVLYENGKFPEAIAIYSKIQPSSDFWLEALEERAWVHTRQGKFEDALADLQSITSPVWAPQVGPETYMLSTFVSLKICAYKDVLKKVDIFKQRMLPRIEALQSMIDKPMSDDVWQILIKTKKSKLTMSGLGPQADKYPRYFYRDDQLLKHVKHGHREKTQARLRVLARHDLDEIETNLKKMKIIDVELIQNVLTMDKDQKSKSTNLKFSGIDKNKDVSFPVNDDEVWVDEVGHFQVKAENCPYRGASL
ncbi:MAG: tetratricopeptide repeat protein [Bdellovibrionaceae bacterium]|nr:tetratricopeptide repeat protein [Pseudobdellovibrionaceae bacterium]